jgi:hypothetical protein|tara:strand:- start:375 stop:707 length:333 start_codon:yes stop_codon:yes gene_type:complete
MESTKYDDEKSRVVKGFFHYFPHAIEEVARVSMFGAKKYDWNNWQDLKDGLERYTDALGRHLVQEGYEAEDPDSGLLHAAHVAWNAMARLEKILTEEKQPVPNLFKNGVP